MSAENAHLIQLVGKRVVADLDDVGRIGGTLEAITEAGCRVFTDDGRVRRAAAWRVSAEPKKKRKANAEVN